MQQRLKGRQLDGDQLQAIVFNYRPSSLIRLLHGHLKDGEE